jgi:hypothetical protein
MIFLVDYDRPSGKLVGLEPFAQSDRERAANARLELELAHLREGVEAREVVILDAESEESLRRTHGRYFQTPEELLRSAGRYDETRR